MLQICKFNSEYAVNSLIHLFSCLWIVGSLSGAFGVALPKITLGILFAIISVLVLMRKIKIELLRYEIILLILYAWILMVSLVFGDEKRAALVATKYDEFFLAPLLSIILYRYLNLNTLKNYLAWGIIFNICGSLLLVLVGYFKVNFLYTFVDFLGLPNLAKDSYSMGGKFVQSMVFIIFSSWFLFSEIKIEKPKKFFNSFFILCLLVFIYQAWFLVEILKSKTIIFNLVFLALLFVGLSFSAREIFLKIFLLIIPVFALFFVSDSLMVLLLKLVQQFSDYFNLGVTLDSSLGQRLHSWQIFRDLNGYEMFRGVAGSLGDALFRWNSAGLLSDFHFQWKDVHSQIIWFAVHGGLVAIGLYFLFIFELAKMALSARFNGGTLIIIFFSATIIFCFPNSFFHSVFENIRESNILLVCLVCLGFAARNSGVLKSSCHQK